MMLQQQYQTVNGSKVAYSLFGAGKVDLVIEMGLGACMGEWWHVAKRLSETHTVLLYERLGCGSSEPSQAKRTPVNIAGELHSLLQAVPHQQKLTLLAHSQGGLYAQQFARLYPELVAKLVLLDPLSADEGRFRRELSKQEYQKSGVDKRSGLIINRMLARLHMGGVIKRFMRSAPPFYYFDGFSAEASEYILHCLTLPKVYTTALEEYRLAHEEALVGSLQTGEGFPPIPIRLITHASDRAVEEIERFGGLGHAQAQKVETIWQDVMREYLTFSPNAQLFEAKQSSHYIHLTDLELVCKAVEQE